MEITRIIKDSVKQNDVILGYNRVMRAIKTRRPKLIVFANNLPEEKTKIVKFNAKIARIEVKKYPKDSVDLGLICGKPFAVSILAIKGRK